MTLLVIAEHDNTHLKAATRNALTAAAQIGGEIHVLVAGHDCQAVADQAARMAGVTRVLHASAAHYAAISAENLAALVVSLAGGVTHILAGASSFGKNVAPRVAALLDVAQVSDICAVVSPDTFSRPIYAGNAIATVQSMDAVKVVTVRAASFALAVDGPMVAPIEPVTALADCGLSRLVRSELTQSARPELGGARVVVSGGRALGSAEQFAAVLNPLADALNAAIGASRAAVDAGFAPNDYQVGQTGKVVAPELYVAIGISGAIQHLAGMKDSRVIVAINKDPDAPIFQVADVGLVGDLFEVVPALVAGVSAGE